MVAFDYTQRPSISEIRQSAWMKEINWELMPLLKEEFILLEQKIYTNISRQNALKKITIFLMNLEQINSKLILVMK